MENRSIFASGTFILAVILIFALAPSEKAQAQWGVGASFEIQDEDPGKGFGFRIERAFLQSVPLLEISTRAHYSRFSDQVDSFRDLDVQADVDSYDFGLAVIGKVNTGLIKPYGGGGLGRESFESTYQEAGSVVTGDFSSYYWNLFVGTEFAPLPIVRPFLEYRFVRLFEDEEFDFRQRNRLSVGVLLSF